MKELLHLFRLVTVSPTTAYCVLCLRTDSQRRLKENNTLSTVLSSLSDEEVWPWKHVEDKKLKVCYICEARLVTAMRVIELIQSAVMADRFLQKYKKKQLANVSGRLKEHPLKHSMAACNKRFKSASAVTNLFLTEALSVNISSSMPVTADPTEPSTYNWHDTPERTSWNKTPIKTMATQTHKTNVNQNGPNLLNHTLSLDNGNNTNANNTGIRGTNSNNTGIRSTNSSNNTGIRGTNSNKTGIRGTNSNNTGIRGTNSNNTGIRSTNSSNNTGIRGTNSNKTGIRGTNSNNTGIRGTNSNNTGIRGTNSNNTGIRGTNSNNTEMGQDQSKIQVSPGSSTNTTYTLPSNQENPSVIQLTDTLTLTNSGKFLALKTPGESVVLHAIYQGTDGISYAPTLSVMIKGGEILPMPEFGIKKLQVSTNSLPDMGISLPGLENILAKKGSQPNASMQGSSESNQVSSGPIRDKSVSTQHNAALVQGNAATIRDKSISIEGSSPLIQNNPASIQGSAASIQGNPRGILEKTLTKKVSQANSSLQGQAASTQGSAASIQCNTQVKRYLFNLQSHQRFVKKPASKFEEPIDIDLKRPAPLSCKKSRNISLSPKWMSTVDDQFGSLDYNDSEYYKFDATREANSKLSNDAVINLDNELSHCISNFDTISEVDEFPNENFIDVLEEPVLMEDDPLQQADQVAVPIPVAIKTELDEEDPEFTTKVDPPTIPSDFSVIKTVFLQKEHLSKQLSNADRALIRLDILNNYKKPIVSLPQIKTKNITSKPKPKPKPKPKSIGYKKQNVYKMETIPPRPANKELISKSRQFIDSQAINIVATNPGFITIDALQKNPTSKQTPEVFTVLDDELSHLMDTVPPHSDIQYASTTVILSDTESETDSKTLLVENVVKNAKMKDGYSMDWEDKIPMDVITYMDATDPALIPKPDVSFSQENTDGGGALGVIVDAYSERDVVCIDVDD